MISRLWFEDNAQDIAEYAVMLAATLVLVVGTVRLIGTNANNSGHRLYGSTSDIELSSIGI